MCPIGQTWPGPAPAHNETPGGSGLQYMRVPRERVAVLIGSKGDIKRMVRELTGGVRIKIDSETGDVDIDAGKASDPSMVLKTADFVKAVGRGFSPERARKLFEDDYYLQLFDPKQVNRLRARIIGTGGKTRRIIEDLSGCYLSIYGNTVAVIGSFEEMPVGVAAVEMVLSGSEHSSVYHFLEAKRREAKRGRWGF